MSDINDESGHYANKEVFDYAMKAIGENFSDIKKELHAIKHKMDMLIGFRWMLIGAATAVSAIVSVVIAIMFGHQ